MYCIALPVETKVRELNGKLWLAAHLALRGYRVAIGELTTLKENLDRIKPHIYIGDSAVYKKSREDLYRRLKKANVAVAVHDTEGGIIYSHEYYRGRLPKEILQYVDCFLAWGNETAEIFRNVFKNNEVVLTAVGNPGFDLLCEKYRSFYKSDSDQIARQFGRFVLINTHFGFYNHYDRENFVDPLRDKFAGLYEFKKKLFLMFVNAIKQLSMANENINFVIRPHPSENFETYGSIFRGYKNVFIKHNLSVHPWALAARMVVHNGCTTGVESALLNRPVVAFRPVIDAKWDAFLPNFLSQEADSVSRLQIYIDQYCAQNAEAGIQLREDQKKIVENTLHIQDGRSAERICDAFDSLQISPETEIGTIWKKNINQSVKAFTHRVTTSLKLRKSKQSGNGYALQKFSHITLQELEGLMKLFKEINSDLRNIHIRMLNNNDSIFWVMKK